MITLIPFGPHLHDGVAEPEHGRGKLIPGGGVHVVLVGGVHPQLEVVPPQLLLGQQRRQQLLVGEGLQLGRHHPPRLLEDGLVLGLGPQVVQPSPGSLLDAVRDGVVLQQEDVVHGEEGGLRPCAVVPADKVLAALAADQLGA